MDGDDPSRWELIRDVIVFQVKLGADALRDLLLSPVSLLAALLDLVSGDRPRPYFYRLIALGRRSEDFIDLFGAADRLEPRPQERRDGEPSLDAWMGRLEGLLVEQVERGGMTAQAKQAIDRRLDAINRRSGRTDDDDEAGV